MAERPKDGDILYGDQLGTEWPYSKTNMRMILDLDGNGTYTFIRNNYEHLHWDNFNANTYSGASTYMQMNTTAKIISNSIDSGNNIYTADFTGASRDGTYSVTGSTAATSINFDAANNEEDFIINNSNSVASTLTHNSTFRDGECKVKIGNFAGAWGQAGQGVSMTFKAFGGSICRNANNTSWTNAVDHIGSGFSCTGSTLLYFRISHVAGQLKTEGSFDDSTWTTISDWTDLGYGSGPAGIGSWASPSLNIYIGAIANSTISFSLQEFKINGVHATGTYLSSVHNPGSAIDEDCRAVTAIWDPYTISGGSITASFSADAGSNYITLTRNQAGTCAAVGSEMIMRFQSTADPSGTASPLIFKYAYQWMGD